ncbi:Sulfotransferase [Gracilaria domingensis]|nr:Sulfotransferase [Gracilaria domingensis]
MFAAFSFFTLDVLHTTSVQSAWNVVVPVSGTVPQPAATLVSGTVLGALQHQTENISRSYLSSRSDPLPVQQQEQHQQPSEQLNTARSEIPETVQSNEKEAENQPQQTSTPVDGQHIQSYGDNPSHLHKDTLTQIDPAQTSQTQPSEPEQQEHNNQTASEHSDTPQVEQQEKEQLQQKQHEHTISEQPVENEAREAMLENHARDAADISNFDQTTALNYFHLHKTGGVSFKERLFEFFSLEDKTTPNGEAINILDTCHNSGPARPALGTEAEWSCDWATMEQRSEPERNKIDLILGHQYWEKGAEYWLPKRDLRYFTVMRHPLHRKISFFFHFFVRNIAKKEDDISLDELIPFLLGKSMPDSPLTRDAGPNYYASRLFSDGFSGYSDYTFVVPKENAEEMVMNSIRRLRRRFVFIGLQTQEKASLCMLKKTVAAFSKARGIQNMSGLDVFEKTRERMNTGSYPLTAKTVWERMSEEQRNEFKAVEKVDLAIYKESVNMFHEMVRRFECRHFVEENDEDSIAM